VEHDDSDDRFEVLEERFSGYEVHDSAGGKVGEVDEIFVDEDGRPEYVVVKMSPSDVELPLIPLEAVRLDEGRRTIEVLSLSKGGIKDGPSYGDGRAITPDFEQRARSYYGLDGARDPEGHRTSSGRYHGADDEPSTGFAERGLLSTTADFKTPTNSGCRGARRRLGSALAGARPAP
jgi:sporulation protein YlmC with PRC-barrel domain